GPVHVLAPAERMGAAEQSALMLREVPRVPAYACETGDWSHVDVYLTKRPGYRALVLAGSRYEAELMEWAAKRRFTVASVGAPFRCSRSARSSDTTPCRSARTSWLWIVSWFT